MNAKLKIERIDVFPLRYPTAGYFKFFASPRGGFRGRAAAIIKVTTDDGTVGWGESIPVAKWSYETLEATTAAIEEYYVPALIGHDASDLAGAHAKMDSVIKPGFSTGMPLARAGLDIALHDVLGRATGKSLAQLWGKPRGRSLELSWTLNPKKLDDVDGLIATGRARGYRHFNIKVAPNPTVDLALAKRVRAAVPDGFLWADANGGYSPEQALAVAPKLADAGVDVLEAPIQPNQISGYRALKKQGALPILMDEGVISPVELEEFIRLDMLDGLAMKPSRCGGLVSNKRQIELIEEHGLMWLGSGLSDPDIALAASVGLYAAYGLQKPAALNGPQFLAASVLREPLRVRDGRIDVPKGPGLGIDVDEEKVIELMRRSKRGA